MIKYYLSHALREIWRDKLYGFINVVGLTTAFSTAIIIFLIIQTEFSYDRSYPQAERIHRVALKKYHDGVEEYRLATNFNAAAKVLVQNFEEVEAAGRAFPTYSVGNCFFSVRRDGSRIQFQEKHFFHADQGFLDVMAYKSIAGKLNDALAKPFTAVLTESAALRYFGDRWRERNILGELITLNFVDGEHEYAITAVISDPPVLSHLQFNILVSMSTYDQLYPDENFDDSWTWWDTYTYVRLRESVDPLTLEKKFPALLDKYKQELGYTDRVRDEFFLQPIKDIHLHSDLQHEAGMNGNIVILYVLAAIAFIILLSSCFNFINLTAARNLFKIRATSIRRVIGAGKRQIIYQLVGGSLILFAISMVLAFLIAGLVKPQLSTVVGKPIAWLTGLNHTTWVSATAVILTLFGFSVYYPAVLSVNTNPTETLKGIKKTGKKNLRNTFLAVQITLTTLLIIASVVIYKQYAFMQSSYLGMDIQQTVVLPTPRVGYENGTEKYARAVDNFRSQLLQGPSIIRVAACVLLPGKEVGWGVPVKREGEESMKGVNLFYNGIDADFIEALDLKIIAGKAFEPAQQYVSNDILVNEAASKSLGYPNVEEAIGRKISVPGGKTKTIVGVIENYNQSSLKKPFTPMYFTNVPYHNEFFLVKIHPSNLKETLTFIQSAYQSSFPDNLYSYFFLDDFFNAQYIEENQFSLLTVSLSILAIIISCLGLLGAMTFVLSQRTKEIAIRKVMGSTANRILIMLSIEFSKVILPATLIAWPIIFVISRQWLEQYAFRIPLIFSMFAVPTLALLIMAFATIILQSIKAAIKNPVNDLKND